MDIRVRINYTIKIIFILLVSTVIALILTNNGIDKESILMVYLVGVLIVPVVTNGYIGGAVASIASVLLFNFLFTIPIHTFMIDNPSDIALLLFFFIASLISSSLTSRFQKMLAIAQDKERTARRLCEIADKFVNITGEKNIAKQGIEYIYEHTGYNSIVVNKFNKIIISNVEDDKKELNTISFDINGLNDKLGEIHIFIEEEIKNSDKELLIKMVINQMGISLDREYIYNEREKIKVQMEREHLRSNLLRGISHDLRTPLTAIVGASGVVIENIDKLDLLSIKKMVNDINEEALWLNNLVENILNMTRIGEGKLVIQKQDEVIDDIVSESLRHISPMINDRNLKIELPNEVISLPMDGKLIVQVIINLLDNAIKHTEKNEMISLSVIVKQEIVLFEVEDNGTGIDKNIMNTLFESFVTSRTEGKIIDAKRGMGIGLAICKAIVNAHGGTINAKNKEGKGSIFSFTLPKQQGA